MARKMGILFCVLGDNTPLGFRKSVFLNFSS